MELPTQISASNIPRKVAGRLELAIGIVSPTLVYGHDYCFDPAQLRAKNVKLYTCKGPPLQPLPITDFRLFLLTNRSQLAFVFSFAISRRPLVAFSKFPRGTPEVSFNVAKHYEDRRREFSAVKNIKSLSALVIENYGQYKRHFCASRQALDYPRVCVMMAMCAMTDLNEMEFESNIFFFFYSSRTKYPMRSLRTCI